MLRGMTSLEIIPCPPDDQRAALELVLSAVAPEQRGAILAGLQPLAEQGVDVFSALVIARQGEQLVGAAWLQPLVGQTGTLWPATLAHEGSPSDSVSPSTVSSSSLRQSLAQAALLATKERLPVELVQAMLESPDDPFAADLLAIGFTQLADLLYLMRAVPRNAGTGEKIPNDELLQEKAAEKAPLQLVSPALDDREVFERLLLASYEQTLDCPALDGLRDIADTIAGYLAVGSYDPSLWFIAHWQGEPAGVLLLSPYPESSQWELTYMGVAPPFRGHGIGRLMLAEVERRAQIAGIEQVVLAVDASNHPAQRSYDAAGYLQWSRRTAYMKPLSDACSD